MKLQFKKKFIDNKLIFTILAAFTLIISLFTLSISLKSFLINRDPYKKTLYSLGKTLKAKKLHTTTTIRLQPISQAKDSDAQLIEQFMKDFTIKLESKLDQSLQKSKVDIFLLYKGKNFLEGSAYVDKDLLVFTLPTLYNYPLYMNIDEINKIKNKNSSSLDLEKYKPLLELKGDKYWKPISKDYSKFSKENLGNLFSKGKKTSVTVSESGEYTSLECDEVLINFTNQDISDIFEKLILKVVDDENIKLFIKSKSEDFLDLVKKNGDLEKFGLIKDDLDDFRLNYDREYGSYMAHLKQNLDLNFIREQLTLSTKVSLKIDEKNYIRSLHLETSFKPENFGGEVELMLEADQTVNTINDSITIDKPSISNGKNMTKLTDNEWDEMDQQIQKKLIEILDEF